MDLSKYRPEDYTHVLQCRHVIGGFNRSVVSYDMRCTLVHMTKSGKALVVVFGNRYRTEDGFDKKRARYVDKYRLQKR